jgi:hypothetical protein
MKAMAAISNQPDQPGEEGISVNEMKRDGPSALACVFPILPGKQEAWRRFYQELEGSRRCEYVLSRQRLGITKEYIWFTQIPQGEMAIVYLEVEHPELVLSQLASSDLPFDRWLWRQLRELHGLDASHLPSKPCNEVIFMWQVS